MPRASIHSFIPASFAQSLRDADASRRDASIHPIDPSHRSFASIRSLRISRPALARDRVARSPICPRSVASSARIVDRGLLDRRIALSPLAVDVDAPARGGDGTSDFHSRVRAVARRDARTQTTTTTTKATRARDAIDRRPRVWVASAERRGDARGDLTSRDSWTWTTNGTRTRVWVI